jgi:hypothetical protein
MTIVNSYVPAVPDNGNVAAPAAVEGNNEASQDSSSTGSSATSNTNSDKWTIPASWITAASGLPGAKNGAVSGATQR